MKSSLSRCLALTTLLISASSAWGASTADITELSCEVEQQIGGESSDRVLPALLWFSGPGSAATLADATVAILRVGSSFDPAVLEQFRTDGQNLRSGESLFESDEQTIRMVQYRLARLSDGAFGHTDDVEIEVRVTLDEENPNIATLAVDIPAHETTYSGICEVIRGE